MARLNVGTGGGGGLTTLIGGIVAYASTPQFVGWAGAGKSFLVGTGTSLGGGLLALGGGLIGGGIGGLVGLFVQAVSGGKTNPTKGLALMGAILGGIAGFVGGVYQGYTISKDFLTNTNEICAPAAQQKTSYNFEGAKATVKLAANDKVAFMPKIG